MESAVRSQLRVKRRRKNAAVTAENNVTVVVRKNVHLRTDGFNPRRADEYCLQRHWGDRGCLQMRLKAVKLATICVTPDACRQETKVRLSGADNFGCQQDHASAGSEDRHAGADMFGDRAVQPIFDHELADGGALSARDDQAVKPNEITGATDFAYRSRARLAEGHQVLCDVTLEG